jgi:hypothetical protein
VGRPGFASQISFQSLIAAIIGLLVGMPFGLVAAALMSALRVLPFYTSGSLLMRRATGLDFRHQIQPAIAPLLAATLMAVVMLAAREALLATTLPLVFVLAGSLLVGIPAYTVSAVVLAREPLRILLASFGCDSGRGFMAYLTSHRSMQQ